MSGGPRSDGVRRRCYGIMNTKLPSTSAPPAPKTQTSNSSPTQSAAEDRVPALRGDPSETSGLAKMRASFLEIPGTAMQ